MLKCRRMKSPQFLSKNWIYSWQWKSSKTLQQYHRLESFAMKTDKSFLKTNINPWSCIPGVCTQRQSNKQRYCRQLQNHVWIPNFRKSNRKITFVVLWHGRSCQEMCGTIMWVGKQDDSTTLQSTNSTHRWPSHFKEGEWKSVGELSKACSRIVLKCLYLARVGKLDYGLWTNLLVRSRNGPKPVTNDYVLWSLTFIIQMNTNNIVMWKQCKTMQIGTVSRLRFRRRSWGFKFYFGWNVVLFWKPHIRSSQLDV